MVRAVLRATIPMILAGSALMGCRPEEATRTPEPHDHRRDDHASVVVMHPSATQAAVLGALVDAAVGTATTPRVELDERLCVVAEELAERTASGGGVTMPEATVIAREAGSVLMPVMAVPIEPAALRREGARALIASIPGNAPLAVGLSQARGSGEGDRLVAVFARALVRLPAPVPMHGASRLEIELDPLAIAYTPELLVVDAHGTSRVSFAPTGGGRFVAERAAGFAGTRVGILGTMARADLGQSRRTSMELLGTMHFDPQPQLGPVGATSLADGIAGLRAQWGLPAVEFGATEAPACGDIVSSIASQPVTLVQRCVAWASAGDDAERWAAFLTNPLVLEALGDPTWSLAELRRDVESTSLRVARRFEELTVEQAHARLDAEIRRRWPAIRHDAAADRGVAELAGAWAAEPLDAASSARVAETTGAAAGRWTREPRWFRIAWSDQDLSTALEGLAPEVTPTEYTLGVVRGVGPQGEPRWFVVVMLALPG